MKPFKLLVILAAALLLAACGSQTPPSPLPVPAATETPTIAISNTLAPDPCAPENIGKRVQETHKFMRAFDDAAAVASNISRDQLAASIDRLQAIRRAAEDEEIPACLNKLKTLQIQHMNAVINTLLAFMGGQNQETTNKGIELARQLHDMYALEMAHLLGITIIPVTRTPGAGTLTPPQEGTPGTPPASDGSPGASTNIPAGAITVTNTGPNTVNMRKLPALEGSESVGIMLVGDVAVAVGRSSDNEWYYIEIPGQPDKFAWVYAKLVTLSADPSGLPIATPQP